MTKSKVAKFAAGFVGFALALSFVVTPVTSSAQTTAELTAMINSLLAQIAQLQAQVGSSGGSMMSHTFNTDLTVGSTGADVTALQQFLVSKGFLTMPAGVAMGNFGPLTQSALAAYQASVGISPASGYFGPITRANVNSKMGDSMTGGTSTGGTSTGSLSGGAGDITVSEKSSGTEDQILEGADEEKVLGFEVEADGSDVSITSVRVEFEHTGSGSTRLNRYVDEVSIMKDGHVVGTAQASDFSKDGTVYSKNIAVSGATVREDDNDQFYVVVTALNNIDSDDLGQDWDVGLGQIRFRDATGAILTNTDGDGVASGGATIEQTFSFEDLSSAGDVQLRVSEDDDSVNNAHTVSVDDTSDTNNVELLSFTLDAEASDITVNGMTFNVTSSSGTGVTEIANDFRLMMDGDEVGDVTIDKDCDGGSDGFGSTTDEAICVVVSNLDDDDVVINDGDEVPFTLVADINDVDGGFASGDKLSAALPGDTDASNTSGIDAEDENGDALTNSELTGSADSTNIEFLSSGITVRTVSTSANEDQKVSDVATDNQGIFEIVFDVTAVEDDAFIELGSATRGTTESNTGANFIIQDQPNSYAATTTGSIALADLSRVSGGSVSGEFIKIGAGQTARFKLAVTFDPNHTTGSSVGYRMNLYSVNFAATAVDATGQQVLTPEVDYRTGAISVGN